MNTVILVDICGNAEILGVVKDDVSGVVQAGIDAAENFPDVDVDVRRAYSDWRGGQCDVRPLNFGRDSAIDYASGRCVVRLYDDDENNVLDEAPAGLEGICAQVVRAVSDAMDAAIDEASIVECECGDTLDPGAERCTWAGPVDETVIVEWMPREYRASHAAARNRGSYPANGALRLRCHPECAEMLVADSPDWAEIVG